MTVSSTPPPAAFLLNMEVLCRHLFSHIQILAHRSPLGTDGTGDGGAVRGDLEIWALYQQTSIVPGRASVSPAANSPAHLLPTAKKLCLNQVRQEVLEIALVFLQAAQRER